MKRAISIFITILISINQMFAQQWAMDEAYNDWRDTSSDGFSFGGIIVLAFLIGVLAKVLKWQKKNMPEKWNFERKMKEKQKTLCLILIKS